MAKLSAFTLLKEMLENNATDLLISPGTSPQIRVDKDLVGLDYEPLKPDETKALCYQIMNQNHQKKLEEEWEVDFSFGMKNLARFRVNVYIQRGTVSAAFRRIPYEILTFDELGIPQIVRDVSDQRNGLVLVTGPTGSGKSTTLAAIIDRINATRPCHIITIEDPLEYLHYHKKATVDQREVFSDTQSFHRALKSILRQDPDVVLLGEMRDPESIQAALTIAETGHLCFATLHTNSCAQTLSRVVDVFPGDQQERVRVQLSMTLQCVLSQILLPKIAGGMQLALEIMTATTAIRALIRENKIHNLDNQIQLGKQFGMQTMNQSLASLIRSGLIMEETAKMATMDKEDLRRCLAGIDM